MSIETTLKDLYSLEGKTIMITGGAGAICGTMARVFAGLGAVIAICDVRKEAAEELLPELDGTGHTAHGVNLLVKSEIDRCVDEVLAAHGRIDGLINGAGISKRLGMLDVSEELYDRIMDVNLKAAFFTSQAVVIKSMRHTGGKILNIASYNSTRYCGGSSVYALSKCGIVGLTRAQAVEFGRYGIQANAIAPGFVETPLTSNIAEDADRLDYIKKLTCEQRMCTPDELMGATVLLMSGASSYITGQIYNVDGGALIGGTPWNYPTEY